MWMPQSPDVLNQHTHAGVSVASEILTSEYPYVLQVQSVQGNYKCEATLITSILALTAAHCIHGLSPDAIKVVSGQHNIKGKTTKPQFRNLTQIIIHENFNQVTLEDDIALLVLQNGFRIGSEMDVTVIPNEVVESEGWVEYTFLHRDPGQFVVAETPVSLIPSQECAILSQANRGMKKKQLCAKKAEKHSCKHDSGGMLLCKAKNSITYLCGILSHNDCENNLSIFTKLSAYNEWIHLKIAELKIRQKTLCPPGSISCSLKNGSYELKVQQCFPHQFRCLKNNNCIDVTLQCDNSFDCGPDDSSDEENCEKETNTLSSCSRDEFQCLMNKECISRRYVCDGDYDCKNPDTSDEEGCRAVNGCHFAQFPCTKGNNCIPDHLRCDGTRDCKDGSDEANCVHNTALVCNATEFQCSVTKKCIPLQYICDDYNDCGTNDLSDELNCRDSRGCHPTQFGCQLGNKCIAGHLKCNGEDDCPDRSDESNCSTNATVQSNCSSEEFQCTITRKCISVLNDVCDGRYDCGALDTSDEDSCKEVNGCHRSQFACRKGNKCIPRYSICDGSNNCRDGSDEENCPDTNLSPNCSSNEFRCGITNKCIHSNKVCDGERDCGGSDESDEENCRTSDGCHWSQFPCRRGNKCIPNPLKCDGKSDCKDGSDEEYCDPKNKFSCPKGQLKCAGNQQNCYNLRDTCDGNDDCEGLLPSDEQNCTVGTNGCRWTQFACLNIRECIRGMYKCDGDKDCTDGSDEENCHTLNSCHSTQFTCKNGTGCIRGDKRCDDQVDCADGSDEENCNDLNECNWRQFACHDKSGCIPGHFKCNWQNDCPDGSDEEDCGAQVTSTLTTTLIIGYLSIPLGLVIVFGCILSVVCFKYRRQQDRLSALEIKLFEMGDEKQLMSDKYAHENAQFIPYNRNYEVKWKEFRISDEDKLGEGTYGIVFKGCLVENPNGTVAVKTVRSEVDKSVLLALLSELKVMIYLGQNENIVRLVGACTEFLREGRAYVLVEYCPMGSLESYLREKPYCINDVTPDYVNMVNTDSGEEMLSTMDDIISRKDLVSWAIQIARGMQHLQNKKVIHGDLASRNVLLYTKDRVKITDFGLSRQLLNYENYVKKSQALLPWRWLALETLKTLAFTSKSDVWAYGITLWEIFSLGLIPYPGMVWTVDFVDYLEQNHRLSIPKYADEEIYNIMTRCWEPDPKNRPDFEQLEEMLQTLSK